MPAGAEISKADFKYLYKEIILKELVRSIKEVVVGGLSKDVFIEAQEGIFFKDSEEISRAIDQIVDEVLEDMFEHLLPAQKEDFAKFFKKGEEGKMGAFQAYVLKKDANKIVEAIQKRTNQWKIRKVVKDF